MMRTWLETLAVRSATVFSRDSRPLTERERREATFVFGAALNPDPVRIVRGPFFDSPVALGNIIRLPLAFTLDLVTLVHELAHVWQYQTRGTGYITNSAAHQLKALLTTGSRSGAYRIESGDLNAHSIHDLPCEKQAVIIERWFTGGLFRLHPDYCRFVAEVRLS